MRLSGILPCAPRAGQSLHAFQPYLGDGQTHPPRLKKAYYARFLPGGAVEIVHVIQTSLLVPVKCKECKE